jgi:hypothetical protein
MPSKVVFDTPGRFVTSLAVLVVDDVGWLAAVDATDAGSDPAPT